ncbi:hypothetical protein NDU88_006844 [Pleurodeles waltl]|uniref:Uncharacterized protein n=1 Tax=Pleurodeles waltl TaxID=8319 RepID=A0AAV7QPS5_PLEWA|nr:hypothetical protein NDU88_006844 [Pleurodeles waltl]
MEASEDLRRPGGAVYCEGPSGLALLANISPCSATRVSPRLLKPILVLKLVGGGCLPTPSAARGRLEASCVTARAPRCFLRSASKKQASAPVSCQIIYLPAGQGNAPASAEGAPRVATAARADSRILCPPPPCLH